MASRMLLVGWDAADWAILQPLMETGEMPALRGIVEAGVSGQLLSTRPLLPVAQWTTLATGKRPWQHRVCHLIERFTEANEPVPVTAAQRRALALWEVLAQAGKRSLVVGWPATHGGHTENAVLVSDRYAQPTAPAGVKPWPPAAAGTYWPEKIGARLNHLRVSPQDVGPEVISRYVPEWRKIDQKRDRRIGMLRVLLATDFSYHAAMTDLLAGQKWDFAAVHFPALGALSQMFLPYRSPRPDWIPKTEFGLYQNVLGTACRALGEMLRLLIQAAGTDVAVIVVSAHGVSRRALPPPSAHARNNQAWRSPHGILAVSGPGFAAEAAALGATVLDVAPTVLTWFGLPIGDDMEGRVLIEAFATAPQIARVATWEPRQPAALADAHDEAVRDNPKATDLLRREFDWNLAQSLLEATRHGEALPILERLFRAFPERAELAQALFHCQVTLGRLPEATETLEVLLERLPPGIWPLLARAELCLAKKELREARSLVNEAWHCHSTNPEATRRLGLLLLRLREWNSLAELARQALKQDDNEPLAWLGLAEALLRQRQPAEAATAAERAIGLNYYLSDAYFVLARALIAQGKWQPAQEAMQTLLRLQPNNRAAAAYSRRMSVG